MSADAEQTCSACDILSQYRCRARISGEVISPLKSPIPISSLETLLNLASHTLSVSTFCLKISDTFISLCTVLEGPHALILCYTLLRFASQQRRELVMPKNPGLVSLSCAFCTICVHLAILQHHFESNHMRSFKTSLPSLDFALQMPAIQHICQNLLYFCSVQCSHESHKMIWLKTLFILCLLYLLRFPCILG